MRPFLFSLAVSAFLASAGHADQRLTHVQVGDLIGASFKHLLGIRVDFMDNGAARIKNGSDVVRVAWSLTDGDLCMHTDDQALARHNGCARVSLDNTGNLAFSDQATGRLRFTLQLVGKH